ncbi:MAG: Hsp20 family protein [Alphaproteobacteria bacterium]|nr:Hsp20 family protein [Alphaproteobacteria bacterium]
MAAFNSPFLLGFDQMERTLDRLSKGAGESYPPYNIEQLAGDTYRITLAVAGFSADDLAVTVEENQLLIRGKSPEDGERTFLHRGIAARQFQRVFLLADGLNVTGAALANGLLNIELQRPKAESVVKSIPIATGQAPKRSPSQTLAAGKER